MISIIIPIYKVEKYLSKCIDSVLNQTYPDLEIILVDDGSPDQSGNICDKYALKDKRIKVIHKPNGGLSDARNAGIDSATGDYIQFVDADDYIHPQMTEILYHNLKTYHADISICGYYMVNEQEVVDFANCNVQEQNITSFEGEHIINQLQNQNEITVVAWNKLYKTDIFENLRYEKGRLHEDEYLIHQILDKAKCSVYTDAKLYYYVQRSDSITAKPSRKRIQDIYEAYLSRLEFMKKNKYSYMELCTKKQLLYCIFRFYSLLGKEDVELKLHMRSDFKRYMQESDVVDSLPSHLREDYRIFVRNPELYFRTKGIVRVGRRIRNKIKNVKVKMFNK